MLGVTTFSTHSTTATGIGMYGIAFRKQPCFSWILTISMRSVWPSSFSYSTCEKRATLEILTWRTGFSEQCRLTATMVYASGYNRTNVPGLLPEKLMEGTTTTVSYRVMINGDKFTALSLSHTRRRLSGHLFSGTVTERRTVWIGGSRTSGDWIMSGARPACRCTAPLVM